MKEEGKAEIINTILQISEILSIFFAGYLLIGQFTLSIFLFIFGIIISQTKFSYEKKDVRKE